MKYLVLFLAFVANSVFALALYNPAQASILPQALFYNPNCSLSVNGGYTGYFVRHHKLEVTDQTSDSDIRFANRRTNAVYCDINYRNWIDLYFTIGASNFFYAIPTTDLGVSGVAGKFDVDTNTDLSGSIGMRGTFYKCGCLLMGFEGEYFHANPSVRSIQTGGPNGMNYSYSEWQLGLGAAYRINISGDSTALMPYFGMRVGGTSVDGSHGQFTDPAGNLITLPDMQQLRRWGYSIGITLIGCDKILVSAEGAFLNETALLINSSVRF